MSKDVPKYVPGDREQFINCYHGNDFMLAFNMWLAERERVMFKIDINLDSEVERSKFIDKYKTGKGRWLANRLGLSGKGSALLATALSNYAWNAHTAHQQRLAGNIKIALQYERIANMIYEQDIQPVCSCW